MLTRQLGRTGRALSVVGFGGSIVMGESVESAARIVAEAVERGVNFFDVAPSYGNAEQRLGPALKPFRDSVFLASKTRERSAKNARRELDRSLRRLRTDRLDLYQFHWADKAAEADRIFASGGAMEAFLKAREDGLIRHIGFSSHNEDAALRMLDRFPFDSVLFPINIACWLTNGFGRRLHARVSEMGVGLLAMKALCRRPLHWSDEIPPRAGWRHPVRRACGLTARLGMRVHNKASSWGVPLPVVKSVATPLLAQARHPKWWKCNYHPIDDLESARTALAFTLSRPVTSALAPSHAELFRLACDVVEHLDLQVPSDEPQLVKAIGGSPLFA
jgi:hypothetical protein